MLRNIVILVCPALFSFALFSFLISCGSDETIKDGPPFIIDTLEESSDPVEAEMEEEPVFVDPIAEHFLSIPEEGITEDDVLEYVDAYTPPNFGFGIFSRDSALRRAIRITSESNFRKEQYIVNTILLKQVLANVEEQCFPGYNMNEHPIEDPINDWYRGVIAEECGLEEYLSKELFLMSSLYYFIKDNPDNDLDYDTTYVRMIDIAMDSCDEAFTD